MAIVEKEERIAGAVTPPGKVTPSTGARSRDDIVPEGIGLVDVSRIVLADPATIQIPLLLQHLGVASVVVGVDVVDELGVIHETDYEMLADCSN